MTQNARPKIAMIAAMARNNVIGADGGMPWHLPEDLKHFKQTTLGKPVIMGRKTYDSIGKPLPGRRNIVITRTPGWSADSVSVAGDLDTAITMARDWAVKNEADEVIIMGGGQIYRHALPRADKLYLTQIHAEIEGDTYFPALSLDQWREIQRQESGTSDPDTPDMTFLTLVRV